MKQQSQTALAPKNGLVATATEPSVSQPAQHYAPRVDVYETPDEIVLQCDLPGARPEDIDLKFESGELLLYGKVAPRSQHGRVYGQEYGVGDFFRSFEVRTEVEPGKIQADYKLGVLTIHLPKKESIKPKKIAIKA